MQPSRAFLVDKFDARTGGQPAFASSHGRRYSTIVGAGTIFALLDPRRCLSPDSLLRISWVKVRVLIRPPE
jgi:hypothetical protein